MEYDCASYCYETTVRVLTPLNTVYLWTQMQSGDAKSIDINVYFDEPGTYTFNVEVPGEMGQTAESSMFMR